VASPFGCPKKVSPFAEVDIDKRLVISF